MVQTEILVNFSQASPEKLEQLRPLADTIPMIAIALSWFADTPHQAEYSQIPRPDGIMLPDDLVLPIPFEAYGEVAKILELPALPVPSETQAA